MAWRITDQVAGSQPIADTSTTLNHPLGTIVRAKSDTAASGEGEFIYLTGVASTVVGDIVEYNTSFQTGLASIALTVPNPLAVAMSANVASQYGWYQISGEAVVAKASALSTAVDVGIGATSGKAVAVATGLIVMGAVAARIGTATSATMKVMIQRPTGPSDVS